MQPLGEDALRDTYDPNEINPAAFLTDNPELNTKIMMEIHAREQGYEEYRRTGVHRLLIDVPEKAEELKLVAYFNVR